MPLKSRWATLLSFGVAVGLIGLPVSSAAQIGIDQASAENDFADQVHDGKSFSGMQLAYADFSRSSLKNCRFANANVAGAHFCGSDLSHSDFEVNLLGSANFSGARCLKARFFSVWLWGNLDSGDFREADFRGATLFQVDEMRRTIVRSASAKRARFDNAKMRGCALIGVDLRGARLTGADLTNAILERCQMTDAKLDRANLTKADLRHADLRGASLVGTVLTGANLKASLYDERTQWPNGFDPHRGGAIFKPSGRHKGLDVAT